MDTRFTLFYTIIDIYFLPESPRWLVTAACGTRPDVRVRRMEQFNDVINRLGYTTDDDEVEGMLKDVSDDTNTSTTSDDNKNVLPHHSSSSTWLYRLKYALQHHLRGLILTVLVCTTASACGFYAFQSYAADVISLLTSRSLQYVQVHYLPYVGLMKLLGTIVALILIDGRRSNNKVGGRRRLLLTSIFGIALAEGVLAALLQIVDSSDIHIPESIPVILFYLVIFFWSIGLGPILLMAANEYMPTYTRGVANSVALTFTSVFEILYQQTFELMLYEGPTPSLPFYIYSITCVVVFIVLLKLLPETKGLSLEDSSTTIGKAAARGNSSTDDNKMIQRDDDDDGDGGGGMMVSPTSNGMITRKGNDKHTTLSSRSSSSSNEDYVGNNTKNNKYTTLPTTDDDITPTTTTTTAAAAAAAASNSYAE
ncbi:hypothetical protein FOZ63_019695 [Perkinsus olseni]|uniref:Major facilitator superfamily (MFS) profile domain-containing protein n=1 Tax=Perkinsus olseni TaxID=32597 RepID=A0A7J6RHN7_PEROL|nr:hypothetical protein FOZ63_019695 [Perkinsus olseni]